MKKGIFFGWDVGILIILSILFSCSSDNSENDVSKAFISIEKLKNEVFQEVKIDLNQFQSIVENQYQKDESYYDKVIIEFVDDGNASIIYNDCGVIKQIDGSDITLSESTIIINTLYRLLRDNIIISDCNEQNTTNLCLAKKELVSRLDVILESNIQSSENFRLEEFVYDLKVNNFISIDEYHFLVVYSYTIICANIPRNMESK